jgi:hypothetical protein
MRRHGYRQEYETFQRVPDNGGLLNGRGVLWKLDGEIVSVREHLRWPSKRLRHHIEHSRHVLTALKHPAHTRDRLPMGVVKPVSSGA